jgi:hypothetical protein
MDIVTEVSGIPAFSVRVRLITFTRLPFLLYVFLKEDFFFRSVLRSLLEPTELFCLRRLPYRFRRVAPLSRQFGLS